ncbi:MAG: hypothetical protein IJN52_09860 [Bacteroidales bacterium]|nr:hypothetical protein [Bacteroidales bacterium]
MVKLHYKFGLIGHPIAHSLSPALFKAGYDGRYPYELIETADFEEAYQRFLDGYDGINVTAPFKELAYAKADILSEECQTVKATNLLIKTPEGVKAYNSDYLGVRMWLSEVAERLKKVSEPHKKASSDAVTLASAKLSQKVEAAMSPDPNDSERSVCPSGLSRSDWGLTIRPTILIVGLGGAGKAAAAAAESLGMEVIRMNRTVRDEQTRPLSDFTTCFREADIIIYNIPTAIPELNDLTDSDFNPGKPKFIMEANYKNPSFDEAFIAGMKKANPMAEYTGGRTWLLYQALTGYRIFTGETPDLDKMSAVL